MELQQVCPYGACSSLLLTSLSGNQYFGQDIQSYESSNGFQNFTKDLNSAVTKFIKGWNTEGYDENAERLSDFAFIVVSLNTTMPKAIEHLTALGFQSTGVHKTRKTDKDVLLMFISTSELVARMKALGFDAINDNHGK